MVIERCQEIAAIRGITFAYNPATFQHYNYLSYSWQCPMGHTWHQSYQTRLAGVCMRCPVKCRLCQTSHETNHYRRGNKIYKTCDDCREKQTLKMRATKSIKAREAAIRDAAYQASRPASRVDELDDDLMIELMLRAPPKTGNRLPMTRLVCKRFDNAVHAFARLAFVDPENICDVEVVDRVSRLNLLWFAFGIDVPTTEHWLYRMTRLSREVIDHMTRKIQNSDTPSRHNWTARRFACRKLTCADGIRQAIRLYGGKEQMKQVSEKCIKQRMNIDDFFSRYLTRMFIENIGDRIGVLSLTTVDEVTH